MTSYLIDLSTNLLSNNTGSAYGLAVDVNNNLYVHSNSTVFRFSPDGTRTTFITDSTNIQVRGFLMFDSSGNLYISGDSHKICRVTPAGVLSVIVSTGLNGGRGMAMDSSGNLYCASQNNNVIIKRTPEGVVSNFASTGLNQPIGLAIDSSNNLYVSNIGNNQIYKYNLATQEYTVFVSSGLNSPRGLRFDNYGNLYCINNGLYIVRINKQGVVRRIINNTTSSPMSDGAQDLVLDNLGYLYYTSSVGNTIRKSVKRLTRTIALDSQLTYKLNMSPVNLNSVVNSNNTESALTITSSNTSAVSISGTTANLLMEGSSTITYTHAESANYTSFIETNQLIVDPNTSITDFNFTSFGQNWTTKVIGDGPVTIYSSKNGKHVAYFTFPLVSGSYLYRFFYSSDSGATFTESMTVPNRTSWAEQNVQHILNNGTIFITTNKDGTTNNLYRSTNGGLTWTLLSFSPSKLTYNGVTGHITSSTDDDSFMIISGNGQDNGTINRPYISTDYGVTWTILNNGFTADGNIRFPGRCSERVAVSGNGNIVIVGWNAFGNSTDSLGNTGLTYIWNRVSNVWRKINASTLLQGGSGSSISCWAMSYNGKYIIGSTTASLWVTISNDYGETFTGYNLSRTDATSGSFRSAVISKSGKYAYLTFDSSNITGRTFFTRDFGQTWTLQTTSQFPYRNFTAHKPRLFMNDYANKMYTFVEYDNSGNTINALLECNNPIDFSGEPYDPSLLLSIGYTEQYILSSGIYTVAQLRTAGFTISQIYNTGTYSLQQLRTGGFTLTQMQTLNVTTQQLKDAGYTATEMKAGGFNVSQLTSVGYTLSELKTAGFTATELKEANFTLEQLNTAGFTVTELKTANFTVVEMISVFTLSQLKSDGYTATELKTVATLSELVSISFTVSELRQASFTASEMSAVNFTLQQLKDGGYTASQVQSIATLEQMKNVGYTAGELRSAGFTASQLKNMAFTALELKNGGYTDSQVLTLYYPSSEVRLAGYTPLQLRQFGYTDNQIVVAGYSATELFAINLSASLLRTNGYTATNLRVGGYTASALQTGGFTSNEIVSAGYVASVLRLLNATVYTPTLLKSVNYSLSDLIAGGYTFAQILPARFPVADVRTSNLTTLANIISSNAYSTQEIVAGGYTATALRTAGISANNLIENYTPSELKAGGYTDTQILGAGYSATILRNSTNPSFTAQQLRTAGYTALQTKVGGFTDADVLAAGFTSSGLRDASYNVQDLKLNNYTPTQIRNAGYPDSEILVAGFSSSSMFTAGFTATQLRSNGYSVADLVSAGYTNNDIIGAGYSASDLRIQGFTISQLRLTYTPLQLRVGGYPDADIIKAGYEARLLKLANFSANDIKNSYTIIQLRDSGIDGYTTEDILSAKYPALTAKQAGYTASQMRTFYTIVELRVNNAFNNTEILSAGYSASDLRQASFTASQLRSANYSVQSLRDASYTDSEILVAGFSASQLKSFYTATQLFNNNYTISQLVSANYTSAEIIGAGYTVSQLRQANFTASQLKENGVTASQLRNGGFSDSVILPLGYSVSELLEAYSYSAGELRVAGYGIQELVNNSFTDSDILTAGYSATLLKEAGYSVEQLKTNGYTAQQIKVAGYTDEVILSSGFTVAELKTAGFVPQQLVASNYADTDILAAGFSATLLKEANYSVSTLKTAEYTVSQLKAAGFLDEDILGAGFTATELKVGGNYTASQLKSANYVASDLRLAQYSVQELADANYTTQQILTAGFFAIQLKDAGYTSSQLKENGYTARQLKIAGYSDANILSIGYTAIELTSAGFTSSQLSAYGYNDSDILTGLIYVTENFPQPPVLTNTVVGDRMANVYFNDPNTVSSKIFGYKYTLDNENYVWSTSTSSPLVIRNLINGTDYTIKVRAVNISGDSLPSENSLTFKPYGVPFSPSITNVVSQDKAFQVLFTDGSDNGMSITNYFYSLDNTNYIECFPSNNAFTISNLVNGTSYNISMKTKNLAGLSPFSNVIMNQIPTSLPLSPTITSITSDENNLLVNFTPGNDNGSPIIYYKYSINQTDYFFTPSNVSPITIKGLNKDVEYALTLVAGNINGESVASNSVTGIIRGLPNRPVILEAEPYDNTSLVVSYLSTSNNTSIYYSINNSNFQLATIIVDANNFIIPNLSKNVQYSIKMKLSNDVGMSEESNTHNATIMEVPSIPDIINVIPKDKYAEVYFLSNNVNMNVTYYKYKLNNNATEYYCQQTTSPLLIYGLNNEQTYNVMIKAANETGESQYSLPSISFVPFGAPNTPVITSIMPGNGSALVYIDSSINALNNIEGYKYFNGTEYIDLNDTTSPLAINGLTNKNLTNISIIAYNSFGESYLSNIVSIIPGVPLAPEITSATVGNQTINVTFNAPNNNGSAILNYFYSLNNSSPIRLPTLSTSFIITRLINGTNYSVKIFARNANGDSIYSNEVSGLKPFSIPFRMNAPIVTPVSGNSSSSTALVSFVPPNNNGSEITGYKYIINGNVNVKYDIVGTTSPVTISNLPVNTSYNIAMIALNASGESQVSANSLSKIYTYAIPSRIIITSSSISLSNSLMSVNFNPPALNGGTLIKYSYSLNGGSYIDYPNTSLPMLIDISNNVDYNIQITATTEIGVSIPSALLTTPVRFVYLPPTAPRIISLTPANQKLIVNFSQSTSRGAPIINYAYSLDGNNIVNLNAVTNTFEITNLVNDVSYNVRLYANSILGYSNVSNIVLGTPIYKVPGIPSISTIRAWNGSAFVTFTKPAINGSEIINYVYKLNNGETIYYANGLTSPLLITDLSNNVLYSIRIAAVNDLGMSGFSQQRTVTPVYAVPNPPTITRITTTLGRATLTYSRSSENGDPVTNYIYTLDGGNTWIRTNSTTGSFVILGIENNVNYNITMRAISSLGESANSNSMTFSFVYLPPSAPLITNANTSIAGSVNITYNRSLANGSTVRRYLYSLDNGVTFINSNNTSGSFTINNLVSSQTYNIIMAAENDVGRSSNSNNVSFTIV